MATSELCITKDAILQKPQEGLTYPSTAQEISPFTMNGAPLTVPPQSLTGQSEYRRLPTATTDISNLVSYTAVDNYYLINLATENILGADPNTTLRFQNQSFTLKFAAIHSAIWANSGTQVSLVFSSANGHFFHICIPITYDGTVQTANPFLNAWLTKPNSMPSGFTMNQILNFTDSAKASFATLEYCLLHNYGAILKPYTFCIFKTPLKVVQSTLPQWISGDLNLTNAQTLPTPQSSFNTYRRKTFDDIFNFIMRRSINVYISAGNADPYLIGIEKHFDNTRTQNATKPAYFQVTTKTLTGDKLLTNSVNSSRGLKNIKCYPIDLVTQVDGDGNIFIDEQTNKPININDVVSDSAIDISGNDTQVSDQNSTQSWIRFTIAFCIIFLGILAIVIVLVVFIFRGTSYNTATYANVVATNVAAAVPAAANAAVPATNIAKAANAATIIAEKAARAASSSIKTV